MIKGVKEAITLLHVTSDIEGKSIGLKGSPSSIQLLLQKET